MLKLPWQNSCNHGRQFCFFMVLFFFAIIVDLSLADREAEKVSWTCDGIGID